MSTERAASPARTPVAETIHEQIVRAVTAWPGVTAGRHRFGGTEFRFNHREIGHLHGNRLADLPFPLLVRNELVAQGRVEPHHLYPDSGWVSFYIRGEADVATAIALFRLNYDRPWRSAANWELERFSRSME